MTTRDNPSKDNGDVLILDGAASVWIACDGDEYGRLAPACKAATWEVLRDVHGIQGVYRLEEETP